MADWTTASPGQATRFEVNTRLEPRDYERFLRAIRWSIPERVVGALLGVGIIFSGATLTSAVWEPTVWQPLAERVPVVPNWIWSWAPMGGALLAYLLYRVVVYRLYIASMFHGQPIGMGETTIVADANGLLRTSAGIGLHVPWEKLEDVIVGKEHMFLMFGRLTGLIVPRRAFANDADAQRFANIVHERTQKPA